MVTRDTNTWQLISEWGHIRNTHHMKKNVESDYESGSIMYSQWFSHAKHGSKQFRQNLIIWSLAEIFCWNHRTWYDIIILIDHEILINLLRFIIMGIYRPPIPKNHPLWALNGTADQNKTLFEMVEISWSPRPDEVLDHSRAEKIWTWRSVGPWQTYGHIIGLYSTIR